MANLGWTAFYGLLAVAPLMLAHEVMHGFGGALFGHGSVINMNAANPQGLESTAQWVIFALSGTIYLFYLTLVLLLAFRKWHKLYLLVVALVAGTVHQVGFFLDLIRIMKHGSLGDSNRSDAFHAGAILWNNGPLIGCKLVAVVGDYVCFRVALVINFYGSDHHDGDVVPSFLGTCRCAPQAQ